MEGLPFLAQLDALIGDGKFSEAAELLDVAELERDDSQLSLQMLQAWPYATHMLCLLHAGRLPDARMLSRRTLPALAATPEAVSAIGVLKSMWDQPCGPQLLAALETPAWAPREAAVAQALAQSVRSKGVELMGKAYDNMSVSAAMAFLRASEDQIRTWCAERRWAVDLNGNISIPEVEEPALAGPPGTLKHLTDYVIHLEH